MAQASEAELDRRHTLADVECKIAGILEAIEDGAYHPTLKARLSALESEKARAEANLASITPAPVPTLPALYRSKVEKLADALGRPSTASEPWRSSARSSTASADTHRRWLACRALRRLRHTTMAEGPVLSNKNPGSMTEPGYCRWLRDPQPIMSNGGAGLDWFQSGDPQPPTIGDQSRGLDEIEDHKHERWFTAQTRALESISPLSGACSTSARGRPCRTSPDPAPSQKPRAPPEGRGWA
jgi:hypothetical protein